MMPTKNKSLVFGYVRKNYNLYVPEVIVKACLLFFDPEVIIKFKGKDFKKFLSSQNGHFIRSRIKFNQQISFTLKIYPNGSSDKNKGFVRLSLKTHIADNVTSCALLHEILCVETQSFVKLFYKISKGMNNNKSKGSSYSLRLSECKQQKELTFKFMVHSLELKFKSDESKDEILFYPSLQARMLRQETSLNWNIDAKRMNKFKNCGKPQTFSSQLTDNWKLLCRPNGIDEEESDGFHLSLCLMSWPSRISEMYFTVKFSVTKSNEAEEGYERPEYFTLDDYDGDTLIRRLINDQDQLNDVNEMGFQITCKWSKGS